MATALKVLKAAIYSGMVFISLTALSEMMIPESFEWERTFHFIAVIFMALMVGNYFLDKISDYEEKAY